MADPGFVKTGFMLLILTLMSHTVGSAGLVTESSLLTQKVPGWITKSAAHFFAQKDEVFFASLHQAV